MKFITGLAIGAAVGYVLGTKAGTEQYDKLASMATSALDNDQLNQYVDVTAVKGIIGKGMTQASEAIRNVTD